MATSGSKPIGLVFAVTILALLPASAASAQGHSHGGHDDRPLSADEIAQRIARTDEMLRHMDTNGNGMIDADEVVGSQKYLIERIFSRMGTEPRYPVSIAQLKQSMTEYYQKRALGGASATATPSVYSASPSTTPMSFGSFAAPGSLQTTPKPIAMSVTPTAVAPGVAAPAGSSAVLTAVVTSATVVPAAVPSAVPVATPVTPAVAPTPDASASAKPAKRSLRFLTPKERLPKGLPDWFIEKDVDGDGQVTMAEFATEWTPDVAAEFARYDLNHDGIITAAECLKVEKQRSK